MEQEMEFVNPLPEQARGLRVFFAPSRSSVRACEVRTGSGATPSVVHLSVHGVELAWEPSLPPGTAVRLSIGCEGEPLAAAYAVWRNREGTLTPVFEPGSADAQLKDVLGGQFPDLETHARELFRVRTALDCGSLGEPLRTYRRFFCQLDTYTNQALIHSAGLPSEEVRRRVSIINGMEKLLAKRLIQRRDAAVTQPNEPAQGLEKSPADEIGYISRVLLDVYRSHLSDALGINTGEVWTAFETFANGELRASNAGRTPWNGEPNGAHLFSFAEFAFMAIESQVDADEWSRILPSLVAVQQIFMRAYRPPKGVRRRFGAYSPRNWHPCKMVGPERKLALRGQFSGMGLRDLAIAAGKHLKQAF